MGNMENWHSNATSRKARPLCYPVNESYVSNKVVCRRILLYQDFLGFESSDLSSHGHCKCCDVCVNVCKCPTCMSNLF